jgi:hypothetical protein
MKRGVINRAAARECIEWNRDEAPAVEAVGDLPGRDRLAARVAIEIETLGEAEPKRVGAAAEHGRHVDHRAGEVVARLSLPAAAGGRHLCPSSIAATGRARPSPAVGDGRVSGVAWRPGASRGTAVIAAEIVLLAEDDWVCRREAGENERCETDRE